MCIYIQGEQESPLSLLMADSSSNLALNFFLALAKIRPRSPIYGDIYSDDRELSNGREKERVGVERVIETSGG